MKKILIPILALAAALTSCNPDLLEIPQKGVVDIDNFYKGDEDAEAALVACYQGMIWNIGGYADAAIYNDAHALFNLPGDDMYAAGSDFGDNDFMAEINEYRFTSTSQVVNGAFKRYYYAIYYCNLLLDHYPNPETAIQKRCVAEARVMRAYMYMMLAIGWDCPPLVTKVLTGSAKPYNCNTDPELNMSHEDLLRWCAAECEAAVGDLDARNGKNDKDGAVKVTKGFADAVAGKAYLFAGDYEKSKAALKKVIDSQNYDLVPGEQYLDLFHVEGDGAMEKVFELNLAPNSGISDWSGLIQRSTWMEANIWGWRQDRFKSYPTYVALGGWGGCGVPKSFADEFVANDGPDSWRLKGSIKSIEDVMYEMEYGIEGWDEMTLEQKKKCKDIGIVEPGLYGQSMYLPFKQIVRLNDVMSGSEKKNYRYNNYVIMRYAEVLLMYAETCVQTGDAAAALPYIRKIQERAGSKTISDVVTMDVVKREKKLELWLEGCRWADMVRWGDTQGVENAGKDVSTLHDAMHSKGESEHRFYLTTSSPAVDKGHTVGFKKGKHEHFPFPYNETSINGNLTQNPGY